MNASVFTETVRRHVTSIGYVAFVVLVALVGIFASSFNTPAALWPSWIMLLAIITGSALIGPEFSTGTLQLIVSKPIPRSVYVTSRVAGVFASVAIAALAGVGAESAMRLVSGRGDVPWERLGVVLGCELLASLLVIAILTFLGSITRSYFNVAIYLGFEAALSMLEVVLGALRVRDNAFTALLRRYKIEQTLMAVDEAIFASVPPHATAVWAARTAVMAAALIALACLAFQRREVPYGSE